MEESDIKIFLEICTTNLTKIMKKEFIVDRNQAISSFFETVSEEVKELEGMELMLAEKGGKLSK